MSNVVLEVEHEDQDLGFGAVVARESHRRLLNRDGSFNVRRKGMGLRSTLNLYHTLLTTSWPRFIALSALAYLGANAFFAVAYFLCGENALQAPGGVEFGGRLVTAFFFSVHTLSTVGYGNIVPVNLAANMVMTVEAVVGLFGLALGTGLIFARFSRPKAGIVFSEEALIAPYRGMTAFEFRIANERRNEIVNLDAKVIYTLLKADGAQGEREFHELELERSRVSFFPLSWTVVHPVDEESPLHGMNERDLRDREAEFLVLLTGIDETFSQIVHARTSYRAQEVVWDASFKDIFRHPTGDEPLAIDVGRIHDYEKAG